MGERELHDCGGLKAPAVPRWHEVEKAEEGKLLVDADRSHRGADSK
jgi:hypothetical protein